MHVCMPHAVSGKPTPGPASSRQSCQINNHHSRPQAGSHWPTLCLVAKFKIPCLIQIRTLMLVDIWDGIHRRKSLGITFQWTILHSICNATLPLIHEIGTLNRIRWQFSSFFPVLDPNMLSCTLFAWWSLSYPSSGLKTEKSVNYERGVYEKYVLLCWNHELIYVIEIWESHN